MATGVLSPSIAFNGAPMSEELRGDLIEMRIDLTASAPAQLSLRFNDWDGAHAGRPQLRLGEAITVEVPAHTSSGPSPMIAMPAFEITEVGVDSLEGGVMELVVVAHDRSHRLGVGSGVRSFTDTTPRDIVAALVKEAGLSFAGIGGSGSLLARMPYFLLADSSLAALNELVGRAGALWWVEPRDKLAVGAPGSRDEVELTYQKDLRSCSVRVNGRFPTNVVVSGWDHTSMQRIEGKATTPTTLPTDLGKSPSPSSSSSTSRTLTVASARAANTGEATALAKVLADRSAARRLDVRGVAPSAPKLVPGGRVKISGFASAAGTYDVQRVEHVFRPGETLETRFVAGARDPLSLAGSTGTDAQRGSSIQFDGLVVGVVTDNDDPSKLGRVKVKYPWLSDTDASDWARVMGFGGGAGGVNDRGRGAHFVPEVNDEVLVGFEGGDLRKPVVLGTLFNDTTKAPAYELKSGKIQTRSITSRLGHVFEMSDGTTDPEKHLLLMLADGKTRLRVGQDKVEVETPSGKPISLKSGKASITITDKGDITIAGNNVTITADANVKVEAKAELSAQGATAKVEAKGPVTVKGAIAELSASGTTAVKGSLVQIN